MSKFGIFATMFMAAFAPIAVGCAHMHAFDQAETETIENGDPVDGMLFSTEFVHEYYEYDVDLPDYCFSEIGGVVYNCPDANLFNVGVLLHWEAYVEAGHFMETGQERYGHLRQIYTMPDGTPLFDVIWEDQ